MANQRLNATIQIGGTVARSLTRGLSNTQDQLGEVGDTIRQATRRQTMLSREIDRMGRQGMNVEPLRRQYAELSDEIDRARRKKQALQRVADADVGGRFGNMTHEVGTLARRTAVGVGAMGTAIGLVTHTTANSNEELNQYARRLGVTTEWLSRTQYAAGQFGIANDSLVDGVKELSLRADEFAVAGAGPAVEAFERLGLSQEEVNRLSKDTAQLFSVVRDRMTAIQEPAARQRVSDELFGGEAGEQFIEYLQLSREEVAKLHQEADAAGVTMTRSQAQASRAYMRSWRRVSGVVIGLRNTIGTALMPVVGDMMDQLSGWLIENRDRVEQFATTMADGLEAAVPIVGDLLSGLATTAEHVGNAAVVVADLVGGFDNLGMIIGGIFAGKAIASVVSFGASIWQAGSALLSLSGALPLVAGGIKAIGAALMANPVGLVIGAIAGAGYLIYRNWEAVGPWFSSMWDGIKAAAAWAWDGIKSILSWSPLGLVVQNWDSITGWLGGVWDGVKAGAGAAWDGIKTILGWSPLGLIVQNWGAVTGWLGNVWDGVKADAGAAWDWLQDKLAWSPLDTIATAWGGVSDWFAGMWDGITGAAERAMNWITGKLEWVGNAFGKVRDWLGFGDDDEAPDTPPPRLTAGRGPGPAARVGGSRQDAEARGQAAAERAMPRPEFAGAAPGGQPAVERVREVTQQITNHLTLQVTRREGEADATYAERIAEMVIERINDQQGALYDNG